MSRSSPLLPHPPRHGKCSGPCSGPPPHALGGSSVLEEVPRLRSSRCCFESQGPPMMMLTHHPGRKHGSPHRLHLISVGKEVPAAHALHLNRNNKLSSPDPRFPVRARPKWRCTWLMLVCVTFRPSKVKL